MVQAADLEGRPRRARQLITLLGAERPGITAMVSESIASVGGNIVWFEACLLEESAFQWTGVVEIVPALVNDLRNSIERLEAEEKLQAIIWPVVVSRPQTPACVIRCEIVSEDHPGLLAAATGTLRALGGSVRLAKGSPVTLPFGAAGWKMSVAAEFPIGVHEAVVWDTLHKHPLLHAAGAFVQTWLVEYVQAGKQEHALIA